MDRKLVVTCEHSDNKVPPQYQYLFERNSDVLETHRGYDIGALELTRTINRNVKSEAYAHEFSRLLVDLNRSIGNPSAFSEFMDEVDKDTRRSIVKEYYLPYRQKIKDFMSKLIERGEAILHLSVHTFTPQMDGVERDVDIGLLYDPKRDQEKRFCWEWRRQLEKLMPDLKYRMNHPYPGTMDGFSTSIRKELGQDDYWGIELEVNQRFAISDDTKRWQQLQDNIAKSLKSVIE
ncbi:MAG: N-formylglutamate amidohydrolase [Balneolaceae bacterium]|nr:N-formylglutamate amidohydrolase [Balneolaceae bacterium]